MNEPQRKIESVDISKLQAWPRRARKHDAGKLKALTASIQQNDLIDPIIIDENNVILSGHLRVAVFAALGLLVIPAIRISHFSHAQKSAYVIAANRFPERGGWDQEVLKLEFEELVEIDCDVSIETTGFDAGEVDIIIGNDIEPVEEAPIPMPPERQVCRSGDLWVLGKHKLLCGSCLDANSWQRLMGQDRATLCITDPPFNVKVKGHVSSGDHAEFAMASGEMTSGEFIDFLHSALGFAIDCTIDGGLHFVFMDHGHLRELQAAADPLYTQQLNLIVWAKTNAGMGSFYRSRHELIGLFKTGTAPHVNNVRLGKYGRNRSNVWTYAGANTFRKGRDADLSDHPTVKPTAMIADAILDASNSGDIVIDGFGGSGTLIQAAERTGRRARVIEIDPGYCDVAIRRWEALTELEAFCPATGETYYSRANASEKLAMPAPAKGGVS